MGYLLKIGKVLKHNRHIFKPLEDAYKGIQPHFNQSNFELDSIVDIFSEVLIR